MLTMLTLLWETLLLAPSLTLHPARCDRCGSPTEEPSGGGRRSCGASVARATPRPATSPSAAALAAAFTSRYRKPPHQVRARTGCHGNQAVAQQAQPSDRGQGRFCGGGFHLNSGSRPRLVSLSSGSMLGGSDPVLAHSYSRPAMPSFGLPVQVRASTSCSPEPAEMLAAS